MTKIDPQPLSIGSFRALWSDPFRANKDRCYWLFEKMRFYLAPDIKADIQEGMRADDPFTLIWNGFCWENIIVPIYILNGEKLDGRFKVLTRARTKYHFVILDEIANTIYDPTYEKASGVPLLEPKSRCLGNACTKPMLSRTCYYFDLSFYLREFELPRDTSFTHQLREYGGRFLEAVESGGVVGVV